MGLGDRIREIQHSNLEPAEKTERISKELSSKVRVFTVKFQFSVDEQVTDEEACMAVLGALVRPPIEDDYERLRVKMQQVDEEERIVEWVGPMEVLSEEIRDRDPEESESGQNA